jgi:hypothetical protein
MGIDRQDRVRPFPNSFDRVGNLDLLMIGPDNKALIIRVDRNWAIASPIACPCSLTPRS